MNPICTQLSFSGGTGSGCIAEMLLRGDLERPKNLLIIRANPGMENAETNRYCAAMAARFAGAGIPYVEVERNLLAGLLELKASGRTRFDLPPFWTRNRVTGKLGRLKQKCTKYYKIAPMDKACRQWMHDNLGVSKTSKRLGENILCKWIGFSQDEWTRIKEDRRKYMYYDYPLIDLRMTKADIATYYWTNGLKMPPRSVCNACYANDVAHFKLMHDERPDEFWGEAVAVDDVIRDLTCIGVTDECFVSSTLIPLRTLAEMNFILPDDPALAIANQMCHSGHCFV